MSKAAFKRENRERAKRVARVFELAATQGWYGDGDRENVTDLLTDMRHYCDSKRLAWDEIVGSAANHYEAEKYQEATGEAA